MAAPPPYYTTQAALQAGHGDLATTIRQLSNMTIKLDGQFQAVFSALKTEEMFDTSPTVPSNRWKDIRGIYTGLMWATRNAATDLKSHTTELVDIIIPAVAEPRAGKEDKIRVIQRFIDKPAPSLLTSERATQQIDQLKQQIGPFIEEYKVGLEAKIAPVKEEIAKFKEADDKQKAEKKKAEEASGGLFGFLHRRPPSIELVDYESKIKRSEGNIEKWKQLSNDLDGYVREICTGLDTIPDRVGSAFSALWIHETEDAQHLRQIIEESPDGNVHDIDIAAGTYGLIKSALTYFATNVNNPGP
ncbi:hypothetical protein CTheo_6390 [Ceratobasidium theobromae]|uniref:Uncharacterized protein n=1 Tax=Ceratobasidium theobromae TaxID=1582974 RepID=A0A5N5QEJ3_9AGAM|nr:hypothetical protein CTheo_6390 [Ceratobasidium theobromae]